MELFQATYTCTCTVHVHFEINCRTLRDKPKQFAVINIVHHIQYSTENVKVGTKRERPALLG